MLLTPALRGLRPEDCHEFEDSFGYIMSTGYPGLKNNKGAGRGGKRREGVIIKPATPRVGRFRR